MDSIDLKISPDQVVMLARQLPSAMKLQLIQEWLIELQTTPAELAIEGFDEPFSLEEAKVTSEQLEKLQSLWEEEPAAEELCQMLTK